MYNLAKKPIELPVLDVSKYESTEGNKNNFIF